MTSKREKLIELLETVVDPVVVATCGEVHVSTARVADHLIANGVTFIDFNRGNYIDISGMRFGRLVALERKDAAKATQAMWLCQCDCGKQVTVRGQALRIGKTQSCGCMAVERKQQSTYKTKLYQEWVTLKSICNNPNNQRYKNYGGRGIRVCDEWLHDFKAFRDWAMANGYDENAPRGQCTLDRIDNDNGYSPDNCRWVSMKVQATNRRR